jgi:hypothetical protein
VTQRRRIITRLIGLLLLGAIVNVAVAWLLAVRLPVSATWVSSEIQRSWQPLSELGYEREGFLKVSQSWRFGSSRIFVAAGDFHHWPEDEPRGSPLEECPGWSRHRVLESLAGAEDTVMIMEARGWPFRALWCHPAQWSVFGDGTVDPPVGGIEVDDRFAVASDTGTRPTLPLRLFWPGFAINTVFYAGILWLLLAAPFALRRWRRVKRGLCPACAYPVGDSEVCTECGKPVTPKEIMS